MLYIYETAIQCTDIGKKERKADHRLWKGNIILFKQSRLQIFLNSRLSLRCDQNLYNFPQQTGIVINRVGNNNDSWDKLCKRP